MNTKYGDVTKIALITFGILIFLILGSLWYETKMLDFIYLLTIVFYGIKFLFIKQV